MSAAAVERRPLAVPVIVPREYRLEFLCDGQPFYWSGRAHSRAEAENNARRELYAACGGFSSSKLCWLVRCEVEA